MKKIILSFLLLISTLDLVSQNDLFPFMKGRNEYYFELEVDVEHHVDELAELLSIDYVDDGRIVAYADNEQYERLLTLGFDPVLLTPPSFLYDCLMYDENSREGYAWDRYPTYEAYEAMMYEFAEENPDKCSIIELGTLESGRKILVARVNNGNVANKPKFLYVSTIHGDETVGFVMMLRLIDNLLNNGNLPEVQKVLNDLDVFICPNANPDGTYYAGNHTVNGSRRFNADGIDMNRNYPDYINGNHPDDKDYAAETEMFMRFAGDYQFTMAATYHGGAELVNYPWDNSYQRHVDDEWWKYVSREYADLAQEKKQDYMTDKDNGITNGADWYVIGGGRQDYMNYYRQCRELTIECSTDKCPPASDLAKYWEYNYNSIFAYMNQCANGIRGRVIDAYTKKPVESTIRIIDLDEDYSMVKSDLLDGCFYRPIKAGEYTVEIKAKGYATAYEYVEIADGDRVDLEIELQTEEAYNMKDGTFVTCNAYFYDSGGADNNYSDDDISVMTFIPGVKESMIQVEFLEFSTEDGNDVMRVYDGSVIDGSICVGELSGTSLTKIITASNMEGALTFCFQSDFTTNDKGWKAILRCVKPDNVRENDYVDMVSICPNPVKNIIHIDVENGSKISDLILYNTQGQIVMKYNAAGVSDGFDVEGLSQGLYFLSVNIDGKSVMKKIVIE